MLGSMCGRIALYDEPDQLGRLLEAGVDPNLLDNWQPRYNVGPTQPILGVSAHGGQRLLSAYTWGLIPGWTQNPNSVKPAFNARGETVATRPTFRSAFRRWRILVPVAAFYEWHTTAPKVKQPYAFTRADGQPVVMAGLREYWQGVDGAELRTATVITTEAGPDMPIHHRQPVVLEREHWDRWLDPGVTNPRSLLPLLVPTTKGTLVHHPVRRDVGNVKNEGADLIETIALEGDPGQNSL
jgi:putative SOS response-associated peptidase YedK